MRIENGKWKVENGGVQDTFHFPFSIFNSNVVLRCVAYGGVYGGTLTLARNGAFQRKLSQVGGDLLPSSVQVPPEAALTFEAEYEPVAPSDAANDIVATAAIVEDFLNETHTNATSFTAVKVELMPEDLPPLNPSPHRHLMGIHEKVNVSWTPSSADVMLSSEDFQIHDGDMFFFCPWTGGVYVASAQYGAVEHVISITVIEPVVECLEAVWNQEIDASAVTGEAGWVGMNLTLYVLPRTVSFEWIEMAEVAVPASAAIPATGYFALKPDVLPPTHDIGAGAERVWGRPRLSDSSWIHDHAQMPHGCPPVSNGDPPLWAEGMIRWVIPVGCADTDHVVRRVLNPDPTDQVYEMEADGTLTIRKYGHSIRRDVSGRVWLDGSRVNAWWNF